MTYTVGAGMVDYDGISVTGNITGITGVVDGIGRSPTSLAAPAPSNNAYLVPVEIANWYDTSNTITVGASSTTITQFRDIVSQLIRSIAGPPGYSTSAYQPPLKHADFTASQTIQYGTVTLNYMVAVVDTTSINGSFLELNSGATSYMSFSGGIISVPSCGSGPFCYYRSNIGTWNLVSQITPNVATYSANSIKIVAIQYPSSTNTYRIGPSFSGGVHEVFFINSTVNSTSVITDLINHLQTKYGVTY
jgi:hypothetical protein